MKKKRAFETRHKVTRHEPTRPGPVPPAETLGTTPAPGPSGSSTVDGSATTAAAPDTAEPADVDQHTGLAAVAEAMEEPLPDPDEVAAHLLIYELEKAALGHGLDVDRELHQRAAYALRGILGLGPSDPLLYPPPPAPYGPVVNEKPIGHSLHLPGDSER